MRSSIAMLCALVGAQLIAGIQLAPPVKPRQIKPPIVAGSMVMVASACLISSKICDQDGKPITKSDALALGGYCCNFVGGAVTAAAGSETAKTKWRESLKALKGAATVVKAQQASKVNQWGWKERNSEKIEKVDQWIREEASSKEVEKLNRWIRQEASSKEAGDSDPW